MKSTKIKTKTKPATHRNGQAVRDDHAKVRVEDLPRAKRSMELLLLQTEIPFQMKFAASRNLDWISSAIKHTKAVAAGILKKRGDIVTDCAKLHEDGSYVELRGNIIWRDEVKGREATKRIRDLDEKLRSMSEEEVDIRVRTISISELEAHLNSDFPGLILDAPEWLLVDDFDDDRGEE